MPIDSDRDQSRNRERRQRSYDPERSRRQRESETDDERRRHKDRQSRVRDSDRDPQQSRPRRGHKYTDSTNALLPKDSGDISDSPSPTKLQKERRRRDSGAHRKNGDTKYTSSRSASQGAPLSAGALGKLDKQNYKKGWGTHDDGNDGAYLDEVRVKEEALEKERKREEREQRRKEKAGRRKVEDAERRALEESERRLIQEAEEKESRKKEEKERLRAERERKRATQPIYADDLGIRVLALPADAEDNRGEDSRERRRRRNYTESELEEKEERRRRRREREDRKRRNVSGALMEEGEGGRHDSYDLVGEKRGGAGSSDYQYMSPEDEERAKKKKKRIIIAVISILVVLAIIIPVAVVVSRRKGSSDDSSSGDSGTPRNGELNGISENDIPSNAKGGLLDPFTWYDTTDMNVTYTEETIGGLSVMGLNSTWDDKVQANSNVPALEDKFQYGNMSIRGMNVGGWLNLEPFITPSFFSAFSSREGVIDEWTLTTKLGSAQAAATLEKHYSSFITKKTFSDIRAAGFDHVRIPFGYWAVTTYEGDPYVAKIAWRYLLRGIEYCRQNGLRVKLDIHGLPGSQNGWNHSGRQGVIGWLNGTDGDLNAQRSLDVHDSLSQFFSQPRYKNLVTMYGLANEPRMVDLNTNSVVNWTSSAIDLVRKNGIEGVLVFGDGFMGLDNWQGVLQNYDNLLLDVHQYVIFNVDQLRLNHEDKLKFACDGWTQQSQRSMDRATGFGPTMCGEWSQADTDCTTNLNNVGWGTRWEGTYNTGNKTTSVLTPQCPTNNSPVCSCDMANADPGSYSDEYKQWLLYFAQAQMYSFEQGWGWFYWTWETESATQWSYRRGMEAGILPKLAYERSWVCGKDSVPSFGSMGLEEYY